MNSIRSKILDIICNVDDLDPSYAKDIEIGIYNWTIFFGEEHNISLNWKNDKFVSVYVDKSRSVILNLDRKSYIKNTNLVQRLNDGEFLASDLAFMPREQVFPERWSSVIDRKIKRDSLVLNEIPQAMTKEFRCKKCSKRECVYFEKQTRSGDEATSLFVSCLGCGNRWKIN